MVGGGAEAVAQRRQQFLAREIGGFGEEAQRQVAVGAQVEHRLQGGKPCIGKLGHVLFHRPGLGDVAGFLQIHGEIEGGIVDQRRQGGRYRGMRGADTGIHRHARVAHDQTLLYGLGELGKVVGHLAGSAAQRRGGLAPAGNAGESIDGAGQLLLVGLECGHRGLTLVEVVGGEQGRCDRHDLGAALGQAQRLAHRRQVLAGDAVQRAAHILVRQDGDGAGEHGEPGDGAEGDEQLAADAEAAPGWRRLRCPIVRCFPACHCLLCYCNRAQLPAFVSRSTGRKRPSDWMTVRNT